MDIRVLINTIVFLALEVSMVGGLGISDESRLLATIFDSYDKYSRPVLNSSETVVVEIELVISKLSELNTKYETVEITGWVAAFWNDERLTWDPREYGGLNQVIVDPTKTWLPDFVLVNTRSTGGSMFIKDYFELHKVTVHNTGDMLWEIGGKIVASCEFDLTYFPYDQQICVFSYINWAYPVSQVTLKGKDTAKAVIFERYSQNGQWVNASVDIVEKQFEYQLDNDRFSEVHFGILFKRKPLFYLINVVVQSIFLAFLVMISFKLPIESGEKISMGVTLLVAFSVLIIIIEDNIPETSQSVPILTIYLVGFMFINTIGICESVLVLYLYHHNNTVRPPKWARKFVLFGIGYCLNCFNLCPMCVSFCHCGSKDGSYLGSGTQAESKHSDKESDEEPVRNIRQSVWLNGKVTFSNYGTAELDRNENEWKTMAKIIDYISFWIFLILFLFLIIIALALIPSVSNTIDLVATREMWANI